MSVCVSVKLTWHEREHARIHVLENGSKKRDWTGMREKEKKGEIYVQYLLYIIRDHSVMYVVNRR